LDIQGTDALQACCLEIFGIVDAGRNAVLTNSKKLNQASALTTFPLSCHLFECLIVGRNLIPSDHLHAR